MSRRSMHRSFSFCSITSPSRFQLEMQIPPKAMGLVIGKRGATIKSFCNIPGISSINHSTNGTIQINADSQQALDTVISYIVRLVIYHLDRISGYFPQVAIFCFCKSVQDPLLSINKVTFERVSDQIPDLSAFQIPCLSHGQYQNKRPRLCFSSGEMDEVRENGIVENVDSLTSKGCFYLQWDFSAYGAKLRSCLEPLIFARHKTLRSMKLALRYGKHLFWCDELPEGVPVPVERLHDLYSRKLFDNKFSAAVKDTDFVHHLQTLGYRKAYTRKKISMNVTDLENRWRSYYVSVRLEQSVAVTKVRTDKRRDALVQFCREGSAATDFRLAIVSYGPEEEPIPEMVKWIENAWRNRSPEGLLVFGPCSGRFVAINMRYEEVDTYLSDDWKLRVAQGGDTDGRNPLSPRWDCVSSSRWFKRNAQNAEREEDMESVLANVEAFVKEGARLSCLMDAK